VIAMNDTTPFRLSSRARRYGLTQPHYTNREVMDLVDKTTKEVNQLIKDGVLDTVITSESIGRYYESLEAAIEQADREAAELALRERIERERKVEKKLPALP
jgi:hypothetical protein